MGMGFKSGTGLLTPKHPVNVLIHVYPSISGNSIGLDQSPMKFSQLPGSNPNHPTCGHHVPKVGPWYLLAKSKKSNWRSLQDPLIIWLFFQQYPCTEKKHLLPGRPSPGPAPLWQSCDSTGTKLPHELGTVLIWPAELTWAAAANDSKPQKRYGTVENRHYLSRVLRKFYAYTFWTLVCLVLNDSSHIRNKPI